MGVNPFRHKEKGRLGQIDRKKNRRRKQKTKEQKCKQPLMAQIERVSGNQDKEEEWQQATFKNGKTGFCPNREERTMPEMGMPRRAYLSTSQRGWPTRSFRRNQNQEKKSMRENGRGTYQDDGDRTCSVCKRTKQGNQRFPGTPRKLHYKRRGWVVKKAARKKGKKHKKGEILQEKLSERSVQKENTKGKQILLPNIL